MLEVTLENFQKEVLESNLPVIVDFWAPWCNPCKQLMPTIEGFSGTYREQLKIVKCNVNDEETLPETYNIKGIPALAVFKEGKLVDVRTGSSQFGLEEWIKSFI